MPISSDRVGVNPGAIATIGAENAVTPAVAQFMDAFRSGFLTVDDLARRGSSLPGEVIGNQQTAADQLQIRPLSRQQVVGAMQSEIALQPKRAENALATEDLRGRQIAEIGRRLPTATEQAADSATREKNAQFLNSLASTVPGVPQKALAAASTEQVLNAWTTAHGQEPPDVIEIPGTNAGVNPAPIEDWVIQTYGQDALVGDAQAVLTRPDIVQGYQAYVQETRSRPLVATKGTPEYINALREDLKSANLKNLVQAAQIKALPGLYEQQAKSKAEAPAKSREAAEGLQRTYGTRQEIQDLRKVQGAYYKLKRVLEPGSTPTPLRDQAAIFSWMKVLDPGSTVREGEYATVENTRGIPDTIRAFYNKAKDGFILTPEQRVQLREAIEPVFMGQAQAALPTIKQFLDQEATLGADGSVVPPEDAELVNRLGASSTGQTSPSGTAGTQTPASAPTAINPQTGQRLILRNGQWQPL